MHFIQSPLKEIDWIGFSEVYGTKNKYVILAEYCSENEIVHKNKKEINRISDSVLSNYFEQYLPKEGAY
jgi:hypothetical protein